MEKITCFKDIQKFPQIHYAVDVCWDYLQNHIDRFIKNHNLQLNPDFQRGHVWTETQQSAYVKFMLKGGESGKNIYFNHPGWMSDFNHGEFVLVDGLQRITAVLKFMSNDLKVYGLTRSELGKVPTFDYNFRFHIAKLPTRADVLKWYLDFNAGGTPHSKDEIDRVKGLLVDEVTMED